MPEAADPHKPKSRKIDAYRSLKAKELFVDLAFYNAVVVGIGSLISLFAGFLFWGKLLSIGPIWQLLIVVMLCALVAPLYGLRGKLRRQLRELEDQIG
jgi:hypothetical protein